MCIGTFAYQVGLLMFARDVLKDGATGTAYVPLVQQVTSDLFDDKVTDIPDLERMSRAMGSLLRFLSALYSI